MGYDSNELVTVRVTLHECWTIRVTGDAAYRVTLDGERYRKRPDGFNEDISIVITEAYAEPVWPSGREPSSIPRSGIVMQFDMPLWYAEARGLELGIE